MCGVWWACARAMKSRRPNPAIVRAAPRLSAFSERARPTAATDSAATADSPRARRFIGVVCVFRESPRGYPKKEVHRVRGQGGECSLCCVYTGLG